MNPTITGVPSAKKATCRMSMPYSPRLNRLPNAQPPANAAPNTSAEMRIAAESTVEMLIQLMRPEPRGRLVASSMARNEYQRGGGIKPAIRAGLSGLDGSLHWYDGELAQHEPSRKPVARRVDRAIRGTTARSNQTGALLAGL